MNQPRLTHPVYTNGPTRSVCEIEAGINRRFEEYGRCKHVNVVTNKDLEQSDFEELQNRFPNHTIRHTGFGYYEVTPNA